MATAKKKPMDKVLKDVGDSVETLVRNALDSLGVATKEDIKDINKRIGKLEAKVAPKKKPAKKKKSTAKKKPARKSAKKKPAKKSTAKKKK